MKLSPWPALNQIWPTVQRGDGGLLNQTQGFHQARYDLHARTSQVRLHILFLYLLNK